MSLLQRHQERRVGGDVARHPMRRRLQIALEEHIRHHALEQDHRRDDDQQRAPEQPARHVTLEHAEGIVAREAARRR